MCLFSNKNNIIRFTLAELENKQLKESSEELQTKNLEKSQFQVQYLQTEYPHISINKFVSAVSKNLSRISSVFKNLFSKTFFNSRTLVIKKPLILLRKFCYNI